MKIIIIFLLMCNSVFAGDLSEHFSIKEFACHHCGRAIINPKLILMLEELRKRGRKADKDNEWLSLREAQCGCWWSEKQPAHERNGG